MDEDILKEDIDENTKISKKPSKRQLKRERALQREAQKRHTSRISAMQRALSYVSKVINFGILCMHDATYIRCNCFFYSGNIPGVNGNSKRLDRFGW